jgi:hypothetical protein
METVMEDADRVGNNQPPCPSKITWFICWFLQYAILPSCVKKLVGMFHKSRLINLSPNVPSGPSLT